MIHKYKQLGLNIVMDVYSGAVHVVDDVMYDMLDYTLEPFMAEAKCPDYIKEGLKDKYSEEELEESYAEICALVNAGQLFTDDCYDEIAKNWNKQSVVKALCIHVAHDCNLRCKYCFADTGEFHGGRSLMSAEVGKKAIDFVINNSGNRKNIEIDYFGGEPLMNFGVVKEITEYAKEEAKKHGKNFRFTLTTNGVLIDDDVIDFANREMSNVVLSLDGRKEINDLKRVDYAGNGSYDIIVPKFKKMVEARGGKNYYMRGTFTHANPDFTEDVFHMADLGFTELSMEPVVCAPSDPAALTEADMEIVKEQYEILAKDMLRRSRDGNPITFYHYILDLTGGPCIYKRISGCGSGTEYMAVTPWGDLYPCHQFVGDEEFRLGDIWQGVTNNNIREDFRSCNVYARPECGDCWAKLYCSGGCAANAYLATCSIRGIYEAGCELFCKRIECAIMMKVAEEDL